MDIRRAILILAVGMFTISCSEKSAPDSDKNSRSPEPKSEQASEAAESEEERQPRDDKIAEDCVAFVRATKVVRSQTGNTDCPGCPAGATEALAFRGMQKDSVSCSGETCNLIVTLRAVFNPASGEALAGGLTAWIPPEQRTAYLSGQTPSGEQVYRVQITYKRRNDAWRAVEFDRASVK